jgi:hypothetical protein
METDLANLATSQASRWFSCFLKKEVQMLAVHMSFFPLQLPVLHQKHVAIQ